MDARSPGLRPTTGPTGSARVIMEPLLLTVLMPTVIVLIVAATAVLVVRQALTGTESRDRAAVLSAVADIIRAIRGRP